jgi:hypothetical protein
MVREAIRSHAACRHGQSSTDSTGPACGGLASKQSAAARSVFGPGMARSWKPACQMRPRRASSFPANTRAALALSFCATRDKDALSPGWIGPCQWSGINTQASGSASCHSRRSMQARANVVARRGSPNSRLRSRAAKAIRQMWPGRETRPLRSLREAWALSASRTCRVPRGEPGRVCRFPACRGVGKIPGFDVRDLRRSRVRHQVRSTALRSRMKSRHPCSAKSRNSPAS